MTDFATQVSGLSLEQRKRLELLLRNKGVAAPSRPVIPRRRNREGYSPLSFTQERFWFIDQLEPGNSAFIIPTSVRLMGKLDLPVFKRCLDEIVNRHEVLRTTFELVDSQPVQIVSPQTTLHIPFIDLSNLPSPSDELEARRLAALEAQQSFDLRTGPLLRVSLIKLSGSDHIALFTMHHIISDGWSMGILVKEVTTLYGAYSQGKELALPELPIQYADFAAWQREWLQGTVLEEQLRYWKEQLGGAPPVLELPTDYPRPPVQSYRGAQQFIQLPRALSDSLKALAQKEGVSLFMLLLAALKVLLHRYSGQEDVVVGTFIANRNRPEIEGLVGVFINNLVLRTKVGGNPRFDELVKRVKEVGLGAYAHQDVPFEKVLDVLQPERDMSRAPLFQVIFGLQSAQQRESVKDAGGSRGMRLSTMETPHVTVRFDLEVDLWEAAEIGGFFRYNTDLFEDVTIRRMQKHFQNLLENIVRTPSARLSELSMLSASERRLLLHDWNRTARSYPSDLCFHHLFEQQAHARPDTIAAWCGSEHLSYSELNRRANRLAHHLLRGGVERGETVAVLAMRGLDLLTAMLAIFKAGAAYLPLDPSHPPRRQWQALAHSGSRRLLVTQELGSRLSEVIAEHVAADQPNEGSGVGAAGGSNKRSPIEAANIKVIDIPAAIAATDAEHNPAIECTPQDLAYIIYTSGSTGAPKGVMIEHRGMLNHLFAKINDLELTDNDVVAQTATQSFVISVWQMLSALLVGGRVQILDDGVAHDPRRMLEVVEREGVTVLEIVPSLLRTMLEEVLVEEHQRPELSVLRWLVVTGEALEPELCRRWLEVYERVRVMNAYGQTECSDDVTHYEVRGSHRSEEAQAQGERAMQDAKVYIQYESDPRRAACSYPSDLCFQHLFEHQVRLYPDAPAALCHPYLLSYRELNRRANRLAHHLLRGGVERGETVAVLAMRGLDLLTAMIAIFKAGAAYLPLDPFYPPQRLRHVVKHSDCRRLLVTQELLPSLNEAISDQSALIISDISGAIAATDAEQNPAVECTPQDLAYIIYTSGSTGAPKGAMIEHRGMLNHLLAKINDLELTDRDVVAQNASQCFDISVWQMLAVLLAGGRVQIFDEEIAHDPARMLEAVEREGVSVLEIVPSLLRAMLEEVLVEEHQRPELGVLRWLVVTGEALEPELCRRWLEVYEHVRMMNAYGPTECSDDVTHYEVKGRVGQGELRTPIGRAVQNTRMYVLDKWGEPSGVGVIGELYVGGDGVGRGYMKDSVQTAERFVPDGYGEERGGRLYRTGDVGRYRGDGEIEFLGRVDHQVKVRGYRIEVGEIEAVLREQEGVREAVVLLREDVPGDKRLVAYIVPKNGGGVDVAEFQVYVNGRLPHYMLPNAFVLLEAMPLTQSGKINRRALPAPERQNYVGENEYVAPQTETEKALAAIWSELLRVERIGLHDNFFQLGGHSLLATQLLTRIRQAFQVELSLRDVFESPTLANLAVMILQSEAEQAEASEIAQLLAELSLMSEEEAQSFGEANSE